MKDLWEDALQLFFCGDQSLIDYVQMICGLCIVGKVYLEAMIIAYGDGRNGKSTFWNVIYKVLGSYSGNISADALTVNCKRNVKPEMAELKGKRMIIAAELQEGHAAEYQRGEAALFDRPDFCREEIQSTIPL